MLPLSPVLSRGARAQRAGTCQADVYRAHPSAPCPLALKSPGKLYQGLLCTLTDRLYTPNLVMLSRVGYDSSPFAHSEAVTARISPHCAEPS